MDGAAKLPNEAPVSSAESAKEAWSGFIVMKKIMAGRLASDVCLSQCTI